MPYVREQSPWEQAAGATGSAAVTLGDLLTRLPGQRLQQQLMGQQIASDMQNRQIQAQQANQQQQLFPAQLQALQAKGALTPLQMELLRAKIQSQQGIGAANQSRSGYYDAEAARARAQSEQKYRMGAGGNTYDTTTGQIGASAPRVLGQGQVLTAPMQPGQTNTGIAAQSPYAPRDPMAPALTAAIGALGKANLDGTNQLQSLLQAIPQIRAALQGTNMTSRQPGTNAMPQQAAQPQQPIGASYSDRTLPLRSIPKGNGQSITPDLAKEFLERASGDKDKARQMAKDLGYTF